ncbi:MAG: hypothetical protein WDN04_14530 [Rhodospirillales bacterium]
MHNRAELQDALQRAERIVVEGDDGLAAYAAAMAGGGRRAAAPPAEGARLRPVAAAERAGYTPIGRHAPRLWPWVVGAAGVAIGAGAAVLLEHFTRVTASLAPARGTLPPSPAALAVPLNPALLAWPAALIALIVVLFFVASRVLPNKPPAPPAWRVDEAAQGRVVIARVHSGAT